MSEHMDLIRNLRERDIELWLADGRICYRSTMSAIKPEELTALKRLKHDIAAVLRLGLASTIESQTPTERRSIELSPITQQQQWIWNAIHSGDGCYLDADALRLQGPLDHRIMQLALEKLLRRHDSLRTKIVSIDGIPHQRVESPQAFHLQLVDAGNLPLSEQDEMVQNIGYQVSNQQCDLAVDPLFEARLLRLTEQDHVLIWAIHHIISDLASLHLMFREFWLLYEQLSQRQSSDVLPVPSQYSEYAHWQSNLHHVNDSYWSARLDGASGICWPGWVFNSGPASPFIKVPVAFGRETSDRLREIAVEASTTLAMTALTIYIAALLRWCNQQDITVAVTVTGRDRPAFERINGYLAHAVYVRIRLCDSDSFTSLLHQVTREFYIAFSHQDFGKAVTNSPQLHSHAVFQWSPWPCEQSTHYALPINAIKLGLKAEPWPIVKKSKQRSPFSQYAVIPQLWEGKEGVAGNIFCQQSTATAMAMFARELRSTAEQMALTPYNSLTAHLSRNE